MAIDSKMYDQLEFFRTYVAAATEKTIFVEKMGPRIESLSDSASICDLGCHDGTILARILEKSSKKFKVTGVDPSAPALEKFKETHEAKGHSVSTHCETAESFLANGNRHFDYTIASHCFYWSPDLEKVVAPTVGLSPEGVIVFRGNKGIFQIQSHFEDLLGNKEEKLYTADNIKDALNKGQIRYSLEEIDSTIPIPQPDNPALIFLIGFFLQRPAEQIDQELIERVYPFLMTLGAETITHKVNFFWWN